MRVLIIGASGLVGGYLYKRAPSGYAVSGTFQTCRQDRLIPLDITDANALKQLVREIRPGLIFLPAAFANVDACEENPEKCFKVNVDGPRNAALAAQEAGAKLVYFSTDYLFDGKNGPYSEDDLPNPLGIYGKSKLEAEGIIRGILKDHLIIRTSGVYGWELAGKNFVVNLIKRLKNKECMPVPSDQITTPTYAGNLADIVWELAVNNKTGIYNVSGATLICRLDFALLAAEVFGLDKSLVRGIKTEEMNSPARRPLVSGLKTVKLNNELGSSVKVMTAQEGLLCMRNEVREIPSGQGIQIGG